MIKTIRTFGILSIADVTQQYIDYDIFGRLFLDGEFVFDLVKFYDIDDTFL